MNKAKQLTVIVVEESVDNRIDAAGDEEKHLGDGVHPYVEAHLGCGRWADSDRLRLRCQ